MLQFNKIIIHNFCSIGHAEVDLRSRGFCLVSGVNNCPVDNAKSNGSGKSTIWNGICFALTGETINGLKTNLKNLNVDEDSCYVELDMDCDNDNYVIRRIVEPKSDMKITKNNVDISGKGIRESERKLAEHLPDINKNLIASTIIIGQGMPNKFSSFSPSGRKELLEKLTKSDFMIEDVKNRVVARQNEITTKLREYDDTLISNNGSLKPLQRTLAELQAELSNTVQPDFDKEIEKSQAKLKELNETNKTLTQSKTESEALVEKLNADLLSKTNAKLEQTNKLAENYRNAYSAANTEKVKAESLVESLKREIKKAKEVKDVCPTCGRPFEGVHKPDTSKQEADLIEANKTVAEKAAALNEVVKKNNDYTKQINEAFDSDISKIKSDIAVAKRDAELFKSSLSDCAQQITEETEKLNKANYNKQNYESHRQAVAKKVAELENEIRALENSNTLVTGARVELDSHLAVTKKMTTLINRDFRGYLLTNIIAYLDKRAKDFCEIVYGTRDLSVYIDGNDLDIKYGNKMFDNLSGGEKQRVDLILQFAIRDMLNVYLNSSANILVLDEITDNLDAKSCEAIMKLLESELNTIESVFIISHHADELELPIDSEIKVVKNADGVSEVC